MHPARIAIEALALLHLLVFACLWLWSPLLAFWTAIAPHPDAAGAATFLLMTFTGGAALVGIVIRAVKQADL